MTLQEMIYRRKSVRSYTGEPLSAAEIEKIRSMMKNLKPLYPEIPVQGEIVSRSDYRCILPWLPPQAIAVFTDTSEGALENAGFMFQQLELQLQCMGLGVCWLGMGRLTSRSAAGTQLKCVMMLAVGHPKGDPLRSGTADFKRKSLADISDMSDERLEPARIAPSSVNSQPWRFTHEGETIHVHCARSGMLKMISEMNRIDVGIALAHLYVSCPESFSFSRREDIASPKGCAYIGSCTL